MLSKYYFRGPTRPARLRNGQRSSPHLTSRSSIRPTGRDRVAPHCRAGTAPCRTTAAYSGSTRRRCKRHGTAYFRNRGLLGSHRRALARSRAAAQIGQIRTRVIRRRSFWRSSIATFSGCPGEKRGPAPSASPLSSILCRRPERWAGVAASRRTLSNPDLQFANTIPQQTVAPDRRTDRPRAGALLVG